jgi:hypothetical protein
MSSGSGDVRTVERAVLLRDMKDLSSVKEPFQRVYFGHEFCQRLLPSKTGLREAVKQVSGRGLAFTLVTPFVTNAGLQRVQELVNELVTLTDAKSPEVVINDWGVLFWLHREHPKVPLAMGRLLTKQKRGPQILRIADDIPAATLEHFKRSNADASHVLRYMQGMGVQRVELDNLLQGISRHEGMQASLYYPFGYVTTTRLCLLMRGDQPNKNLRSIGTCSRECLSYDVTLSHADMPVPLLLRGNTQYFRNDKLPDDLAALNITRLVHQIHLP